MKMVLAYWAPGLCVSNTRGILANPSTHMLEDTGPCGHRTGRQHRWLCYTVPFQLEMVKLSAQGRPGITHSHPQSPAPSCMAGRRSRVVLYLALSLSLSLSLSPFAPGIFTHEQRRNSPEARRTKGFLGPRHGHQVRVRGPARAVRPWAGPYRPRGPSLHDRK
jgi:hypothetical protein